MDAFTEKILARARERQKMLEVYGSSEGNLKTKTNCDCSDSVLKDKRGSLSDSNLGPQSCLDLPLRENSSESNLPQFSRQNSRTRVSSDIPGSPKTDLKTLNIQQDNFNMEITVTSTENVRVEVEIGEQEVNSSSHIGSPKSYCGLRDESKKRLKQLGKLYEGGDECNISSPIHRTEAKFHERDTSNLSTTNKTPKSLGSGLKKLANLAQTINQWEDDINSAEKKDLKRSYKSKAPQPPNKMALQDNSIRTSLKPEGPHPPNLDKYETNKEKENCGPERRNIFNQSSTTENNAVAAQTETPSSKKVNWDKNILDSLESQGFTRTHSNSRLIYSYNTRDRHPDVKMAQKSLVVKDNANSISEDEEYMEQNIQSEHTTVSTSVTSKIVDKFESSTQVNKTNIKNPTKDKPIVVPGSPSKHIKSSIADKAAIFEISSPSKTNKDPALLSVSERKALFEKNKGEVLVPKAPFGMAPPVKIESIMKASSTKIMTDNNFATNKYNNDKSKPLNGKPEVVKTKQSQIDAVMISNSKPVSKKEETSKTVLNEVIPRSKSLATERDSPTAVLVQKSGGIASRVAALMKNKSTISETQIETDIKSQRQKEMDMLLNRFNKNKEISNEIILEEESEDDDTTEETAMLHEKGQQIIIGNDPPRRKSAEKRKSGSKVCSTEDSPVVAAILEDVKRIKVSPARTGRLYPNLSDIEATTETETDNQTRTPSPEDQQSSYDEDNSESDIDPNTSFGREILETVCKNNLAANKRSIYEESTASDLSSLLEDDYIDDLSNEDNISPGPTPPKQVCQKTPQKTEMQPSNSFNYKSFNTPQNNFSSPLKSPPKKSSDVQTYVVEGDDVLPLAHTVSFYRKQQNLAQTPVRQITRLPSSEESEREDSTSDEIVEMKIQEMKEEIHKQQNIISQTSRALNLCSSTPEFSGSTEQVEAERVLLLATHRRQAALHELQRLKVEKSLRPQNQISRSVPIEKGTLTITNIVLPLKQKYVKALAAAGGKGHHVVCLIKCGEQVVPTKLVSTVASNATNPVIELDIPGSIILKNIYSDFTITFEVYCLQAQEEFLPHEVKYHINKKGNNKLVTPKKSKQESRMVMPIKESPAGPQAVRTSSFAMMGYIVFSVQAINKKVWTLNNTPPMSPLEGVVEMRISCELAVSVEHRGFLTMFEDVSGFGAWHRRWCLLKGHSLSYWKYPDDEKKKAPIDTIDLDSCITKNVGPVSRDICARLHTFLIETERDALPYDKDSLVTVRKGDKTIMRHLLSADTKEERIEWCTKLNAAFTALRMWGNSQ